MSTPLISKTTFVEFLSCPKNTWLKLHKPELWELFTPSDFEKQLMEQGNEVEAWARKLFPEGVEITARGEAACIETEKYMATKVPVIFQATFIVDGFIAKNDVLVHDKTKDQWDIYEVKGTNSIKDEGDDRSHVDDLTFQTAVLKRVGIRTGRSYLIHLNKEYERQGDLNVASLFTTEDLTDMISERLDSINAKMEASRTYLTSLDEPKAGCDCNYLGRSRHCTTFRYSHPEVPDYSIHDLTRIGSSKKKLEALVEMRTYSLGDIPADFELTDNQSNQLASYKTGKPFINHGAIRENLDSLKFPLHFLDYETYAPAVPHFDGYHPYNRIPFQFSLHVLREPEGNLEHIEFLNPTRTDPTEMVAKLLGEYIDPTGTVIVWHKPMEQGMNKEIAVRTPHYKETLDRINEQVYDLKDIFAKQHYVDSGFRGSASIKKVLPVLVPELAYDDLTIHGGTQASEQWWKMVAPETDPDEHSSISLNLKEYCARDTYAMYAIWKYLKAMVS